MSANWMAHYAQKGQLAQFSIFDPMMVTLIHAGDRPAILAFGSSLSFLRQE